MKKIRSRLRHPVLLIRLLLTLTYGLFTWYTWTLPWLHTWTQATQIVPRSLTRMIFRLLGRMMLTHRLTLTFPWMLPLFRIHKWLESRCVDTTKILTWGPWPKFRCWLSVEKIIRTYRLMLMFFIYTLIFTFRRLEHLRLTFVGL